MRVDTIKLSGLSALGTHGVLDFEHQKPQKFSVDITFAAVTEHAVQTDDITDTISYADIADRVVERITGEHVNLIETLADRIACDVLGFGAREVCVTVHKPQAPIEHSFGDVSVTAHRKSAILDPTWRKYVIGLGSNLENPRAHVVSAIEELSEVFEVRAESKLFGTTPILAENQSSQPDYVNAVVVGYSAQAPLEVLHSLQKIEWKHGRERHERWGARTLDLDIVQIEGVCSTDPELVVPHPRASQRRFVLEPWSSVDPDGEINGQKITELLAGVRDQEVYLLETEGLIV